MATIRRSRRRRGPRYVRPARGLRHWPPALAEPRSSPAVGIHGRYSGICINVTVGKTASLAIQFAQGADGTISGSVHIGEPLYGSGPLTGSVIDGLIRFRTTSPFNSISWTGVIMGRRIYGAYEVTTPLFPDELGTWSVSR